MRRPSSFTREPTNPWIGNAKLAGFDKDLGLVGYDYNKVLSVFFISYIIFEIPSNLMCKWVGPGWWLPAITLGFGICSVATAFVHDIHSASGVRFLLGYVRRDKHRCHC